jgi:uncharacterized membrane protein
MTRKIFLFEILLIAAALVATVTLYPHLPAQVPTHWNAHMEPDHYGSRGTLYLIGPGFMAGTMLLTLLLPWLSPKPFEIDSFRAAYHQVMLMVFSLMAYIYAITLWAAIGHPANVGRAIAGGVCLFIALFGNMMGKVRRNFYIGIRTPWTLANERVWYATHRFAAKTFVAGGLVGLALAFIGHGAWPLYALLAGGLAPVVYSLVYYKQLERRGELEDGLSREQGES